MERVGRVVAAEEKIRREDEDEVDDHRVLEDVCSLGNDLLC